MGPGFTNSSSIPEYLEIPESAQVMILESEPATREYEGFTPTSFYALIDFDLEVTIAGEYYFAVYETDEGGAYSIALGYVESFTFEEWLLVPFSVMTIHQWNGQSLPIILAPMVATILLSIAFLLVRQKEFPELRYPFSWIGAIGAIMFIGSGVTIFYQMTISALFAISPQIIISIIFGLIPLLLGFFTLQIVLTDDWHRLRSRRVRLLLYGLIAPFLWAGLFVGPVLVIVSTLFASIGVSRSASSSING